MLTKLFLTVSLSYFHGLDHLWIWNLHFKIWIFRLFVVVQMSLKHKLGYSLSSVFLSLCLSWIVLILQLTCLFLDVLHQRYMYICMYPYIVKQKISPTFRRTMQFLTWVHSNGFGQIFRVTQLTGKSQNILVRGEEKHFFTLSWEATE